MLTLLVLLALSPVEGLTPAAAQEARPDGKIVVTLQDGSRFSAALPEAAVVLKTEYGEQRIPFKDILSIRRAAGKDFAVRTSRITVQGALAVEEFEFAAEIGKLKIPAAEIKSIDVGGRLSIYGDDQTLALWAFDDAQGDKIVDLVKERALTLKDTEVKADSTGVSALTRRTENGYAEAPGDGLEFGADDFTLEARVKVGTTRFGYVSVVSLYDKANVGHRTYCMMIMQSGQIYWDSISNLGSFYTSTPARAVNVKEWSYVAIVFDQKKQTVTFYADGKQVHHHRQAYKISPNPGRLFVGGVPQEFGFGAPEAVQFVRISKGARNAEEIAEVQKSLEAGSTVSWRSATRGVGLRDGGFLRADFPRLAGTTFKTKFGSLKISETAAGQITIYRYREHELARVQDEVKELIAQLGSQKIDDREEAQLRIIRIGTPAIPLLKENANDTDDEIRERIKAILKKFDETGVAKQPIGDVFRMGQTVLHGWLQLEKVEVETKYGAFELPLGGVHALNLGEAKLEGKQVMKLKTGESIQGEPPKGFVMELETEYGTLKVPFKDVTRFSYNESTKMWTVRTDKMSAAGKVTGDRIDLETPAGTISVPISEVVSFGLPGQDESGSMAPPIEPDEIPGARLLKK